MNITFKKFDNKSPLTVCVVDNCAGAYLPVAKRLSKFFSKTYFHSVNQNPFPRISLDSIGTGYDDVIRCDEFWGMIEQFDVIVFPDIYFNDYGARLRKMGKLVFGGCESEVLETNRKIFKQELESVGLPIAPTKYITGLIELTKYLQTVEDKWIKISYHRGDLETFHHIDFNHSKQWLNEIGFKMGPLVEQVEFLVEDPINSVAEIGSDGWCVNGQYPSDMLWGIEVKDCGYIGKRVSYEELPTPIKLVNDKFGPVLQKYKHTGFYSNEIRYTEAGESYYTDGALRAGSPPSNTYLDMIDNWDQIIIGACKGELVEPNYIAEYGVEIILKSAYCSEGFLNVSYPPEYQDNIKLKGSFKIDDVEYVIPFNHCGFDMVEFGSVVVVGDVLQDCIEKAIEIAHSVEGYKIEFNEGALPNAIDDLNKIQELLNIKF